VDKDEDARLSLAKDGADAGEGPSEAVDPSEPVAAEPVAAEPKPPNPRVEAFVSGAAYGALALLGALVGLVGSFAQDWTAGSSALPVAAVVLIAVNFGMVRLAGWGMGTRLGAVIPTLTWAAVVFLMSQRRPEGDLVVPGTTPGYVYLIGGLVAAVIAVALVPVQRPPGDWLTGGAGRTRG
jgi:Flp pilus assembly pilin Flp